MRILYYFAEGDTNMSLWQREQIFNNLSDNGIDVVVFNYKNYANIDEANQKVAEETKKEKYDFFLTPYNEKRLYIETIKEIKKNGTPTVLICFDNLIIPYEHKRICKYYDVVWLTSMENKKLFERWSCGRNKVLMMPYASNPNLWKYKQEETGIQTQRCVFVGSVYGSRVHEINSFLKLGAQVDLYTGSISNQAGNYGNTSKVFKTVYDYTRNSVGRKIIYSAIKQRFIKETLDGENENLFIKAAVPFDEMSSVYANHALSIATTFARNTGNLKTPVPVVNLRSFEIPTCGGLQITAYNKELADYFEEGKEILFYRSEGELKELLDFYTKHSNAALRQKMKSAARQRVENDHTWVNRFLKIYEVLGIKCGK